MTTHLDSGRPAEVSRGRRLLLGLVPAASLALVVAACATAASSAVSTPAGSGSAPRVHLNVQVADGGGQAGAGAPPQTSLDTLTQPMEITSRNGVLDVTLAALFMSLPVPQPDGTVDTMTLRTYQVLAANGTTYAQYGYFGFPGPTLRVFRGDSVHIRLRNLMLDSVATPSNPPGDTSNTQCADYPAANASVDSYQDCFHGANWTNLHFHGMHVTPAPNGDDVLALIPPGTDYEYGFRIPGNQSPGTHWYHPHKHGSVAIQVVNGMSGALIVDGSPLDALADRAGMTERLIALQQIDTFPNLMKAGVFGQNFLVNGQQTPVIRMAPGEVQRWRIVNENVTKTNNFQIAIADTAGTEPSFYEVARDGVTYTNVNYAPSGTPQPDPVVLMAPGNRLDLFVQAPQNEGMFAVHAVPVAHSVPQDKTRKPGLRRAAPQPGPAAAAAAPPAAPPLFYVQVDDDLPNNGSWLPGELPWPEGFLANLPGTMDSAQILADPRTAVVVFADSGYNPSGNSHAAPPAFYLGTAQNPRMKFNSNVTYVPQSASGTQLPMVLDSVQTWQVINWSPATNHPFHIHINPFQVIDVFAPNPWDPNQPWYAQLDSAAQVRNSPIWLDVVPLPLPLIDTTYLVYRRNDKDTTVVQMDTTPGYVIIRQGYEPFLYGPNSPCPNCGPPTGWFVMHCHILGHEERGMMQVLQIVNPGDQPSNPPQPGGTGAGHSHATPRAGAPPGGHSHH